jgi:tRNA G46 methylase TrmB
MAEEQSHRHHHGHAHFDEADWEAFSVHAELEGELLLAFVTDSAHWIAELRGPDAPPVRRVLDIGSGPGVGTCELARRFPDAHVVAVDGSPERHNERRSTVSSEGSPPTSPSCQTVWTVSSLPMWSGRRCRCTTSAMRPTRSMCFAT